MPGSELLKTELDQVLVASDQSALNAIIGRAIGAEVGAAIEWRLNETQSVNGCAGYAAPKALAQLVWKSQGRTGTLRVVVKWFRGWKGGGEALAYRLLTEAGAPVPRCFGSLRDAGGDAILFLEELPHIGFDPSLLDHRLAVARSLAALHRMDTATWLRAGFPSLHYVPDAERRRTQAFTALAALHGLGGELAQRARNVESILAGDSSLVLRLSQSADSLPKAVIHRDNPPQNAGWREEKQELLWFDWHKAAIGAAWSDLLCAFPNLDKPWNADDEAVGRCYLEGVGLRADQPLAGALRCLWCLQSLSILTWHTDRCRDGRVDWTEDVEEGARIYRGWTVRLLTCLEAILAAPAGEGVAC